MLFGAMSLFVPLLQHMHYDAVLNFLLCFRNTLFLMQWMKWSAHLFHNFHYSLLTCNPVTSHSSYTAEKTKGYFSPWYATY